MHVHSYSYYHRGYGSLRTALTTWVYLAFKTSTTDRINIMCRTCSNVPESLAHILAIHRWQRLYMYMDRQNAALKVLFFKMLRDFKLANSVPPWYSRVEPKLLYKSDNAQTYLYVPVYREHTFTRASRVDAQFLDHKAMRIVAVEMSCPWLDNCTKRDSEKTPNSIQATR